MMTVRFKNNVRILLTFGIVVAGIAGLAAPTRAQVVTAKFSQNSGIYSYLFSVLNNTSTELAFVSVTLDNVPFTVGNLSAPTGFAGDGSIVGNTGYVNFYQDLDDTTPQTFAPGSTVQYFRFTSNTFLGGATVESSDINGGTSSGSGSGVTFSAAAPEPATLPLIALALTGLPLLRRRLRKI